MNSEQARLIHEAIDQLYKLTEWEADFVYNLADGYPHQQLSEKQDEILKRIERKLD